MVLFKAVCLILSGLMMIFAYTEFLKNIKSPVNTVMMVALTLIFVYIMIN